MGIPGTGDSLAAAQALEGGKVAASSDDTNGALFSRYQQLAKEHSIWLSLGVCIFFIFRALACSLCFACWLFTYLPLPAPMQAPADAHLPSHFPSVLAPASASIHAPAPLPFLAP